MTEASSMIQITRSDLHSSGHPVMLD